MRTVFLIKLSFLILCIGFVCAGVRAQTSAFTYQGKLTDAGVSASGQYDFTFRLFPVAAGGAQIGADVVRDDVTVANGVFTVNLDFGAMPFASLSGQFLEILIRPGASTGAYTALNPRLALSSTPYSVKSLDATNLGGVAANQYLTTAAANTNYIQNTGSLQSASFNIDGNGYVGGRFGVGSTAPAYKFEVIDPLNTGLRVQTNTAGGTVASFGGVGTFAIDAPFQFGGRFVVLENGNVGLGTPSPVAKLELSGFGVLRARVNSDTNAGLALSLNNQSKWSVATVTDGNFQIFNDAIGQNAVWISGTTNNVGIGSTPSGYKLMVRSPSNRGFRAETDTTGGAVASFGGNGDFEVDGVGIPGGRFKVYEEGLVTINGRLSVNHTRRLEVNGTVGLNLGAAGIVPICYSVVGEIAGCVSSIRYKENVRTFNPGLELVKRLRPVTFDWKTGNIADLGLIAEEVAEAEPLLTTRNNKGEVEGVKYDRVGVVLVNAVKEQQVQIEQQKKQIDEQNELIKQQAEKLDRQQTELERQKSEFEALKKLVCARNEATDVCQPKKQF